MTQKASLLILVPMLGVLSGMPTRAADLWGLVIGIDQYRYITPLRGAVNDALDIEAALRDAGAQEVRRLLDADATREAIIAAYRDLTAKAAPGDLLVFSFAGHGSQEAERVHGSERDGLDEVLLLAGFDPDGWETQERIPDDDLNQMLRDASHLNILFVVDACHSGTVTRSVHPRSERFVTSRNYIYPAIERDFLPPPDPVAARIDETELAHVVLLAGVSDENEVPEVWIEQADGSRVPRGAMSWSVAEALRGRADADGDRRLTKGELERFMLENVRMKTNDRQQPVVTPVGDAERVLIAGVRSQNPPAGPTAPPPVGFFPLQELSLFMDQTGGFDTASVAGHLDGVTLVDQPVGIDLVWNVATGEIIVAGQDAVATVKDALVPETRAARRRTLTIAPKEAAAVQAVLDKWGLHKRLIELSADRSLTMRLVPPGQRFPGGAEPELHISGHTYPFLTLFLMDARGRIIPFYPWYDDDPLQIPMGRAYPIGLTVEPPFGADHFVAIASDHALIDLHERLKALDGQAAVPEVARLLDEHLRGVAFQLGVHAMFTGE